MTFVKKDAMLAKRFTKTIYNQEKNGRFVKTIIMISSSGAYEIEVSCIGKISIG